MPLTFCSPVEEIDSTRILAQYIGLAEGILKPWIIAQLRNQITIGAAGGNFAGSPETLKRYLTAASLRLGSTQDLILWADAGAIANKNVMRQYRRTYELVTRWGYTLKVAWWGQLDKSCADPDEYAGELAVTAPELFIRFQPTFERLRFLFWGGKFGEGSLWAASDIQLPTCGRYDYDDTAIRQLLGQPPDDIADIINQLTVKLAPDLRFLVESADSIDTSVGTKSERAASRQINKLLRSVASLEVKQALEAVSLNWLIPLLEVWGGYMRGALHFDRGILSLHQQDTRHRDVANAAQYNIYLDGTLDVRYLALKLGVGVEDVLVVEQVTPQYENLKVVQITNMGVLGRDRRE
ncbi:hypothetical protein H6G66_28870 [Fischerella sp. FACHB-380]|nr:hypothetical protein [Fischerella sp. FACHB-380]